MNARLLIAAGISLFIAAPAFAMPMYYVAHKPNDKVCSVVTPKPNGKNMIMVGKAGYANTADAAAAMRAAADCKK